MSDEVKKMAAVPPPLPERKTVSPATLRRMLFTPEERKRVVELVQQVGGFMYSDHNARWVAKHLTELAEIVLGEKILKEPTVAKGLVNQQPAGSQASQLPRGARSTHTEIKDARGRVIQEVVDGEIFDVDGEGNLVPHQE